MKVFGKAWVYVVTAKGDLCGVVMPSKAENEPEQEEEEEDTKEESDDEDDDDEESGRLRFKTERKDATVVRLSDAARKRRNIPETLGELRDGNWEGLICKRKKY